MIKRKIFLASAFFMVLIISAISFTPLTAEAVADIFYANPTEYRARIITGNTRNVRADFKNAGNSSIMIQIGNSPAIALKPGNSTYYPLEGNSIYYLSFSSSGKNVQLIIDISNGYVERGW